MLSSNAPDLLIRQRERWKEQCEGESQQRDVHPWTCYEEVKEAKEEGKLKTGCLVLAGGEGTRLGMKGPKGTTPVTLFRKKSLFQLLCEKTKAASERAGDLLPLALMTSPLNHEETLFFLKEHAFFGLHPQQFFLFQQNLLPYLDEEGNWILLSSQRFASGPDGNGGALRAFYEAGIWKQWQELGVHALQIVLIDNPLADPFDEKLIDAHRRSEAQVTLKCILRRDEEEKVGVIVSEEGKPKVVEYSEIPLELRRARKPGGELLFSLANTSLFCMSMESIREMAVESSLLLPWHLQKKRFMNGTFWQDVWKFETFIFDLLPYAKKVHLLLYPREETFAPLKNAQGEASLQTVQEALLAADRRQYAKVTEVAPPVERVFELDPAFYYPTPLLLKKWRGRALPPYDYIARDL